MTERSDRIGSDLLRCGSEELVVTPSALFDRQRVWFDCAVELSADDAGLEDRATARSRQHCGAQTRPGELLSDW